MTAVVLGATKGIGRAVARELAERGDRLFLLGRDAADLARSVQDLDVRKGGATCAGTAQCDLADPATFAPALAAAKTALGEIDLVVLTAGRSVYRVLIRSNDSTSFQIARVECGVPGIRARSEGEAATQQVVTLKIEDPAAVGTAPGALTVHVDHPSQKTIEVPIVSVE